jgi:hypothetical protein
VVKHLSRADHFNKLAKRCPKEHRHLFYELKDRAIDRAICHNPDEFKVDSISYGFEPILGITHLPSGRRLHARPYRQAYETQTILHSLATAENHHYRFLRYADDRQQLSLSARSDTVVTGGAA